MADLREFGKRHGWCPYFLARHMINLSQVVVRVSSCIFLCDSLAFAAAFPSSPNKHVAPSRVYGGCSRPWEVRCVGEGTRTMALGRTQKNPIGKTKSPKQCQEKGGRERERERERENQREDMSTWKALLSPIHSPPLPCSSAH